MNSFPWTIGGRELQSRLLLGTANYPSFESLKQSLHESGAQVVTVSLRRSHPDRHGGNTFWKMLQELNLHLLPNTAGCRSAKEAIETAVMAREIFQTQWIKLEVIGDDYHLAPDPFELVEAAKELVQQGFVVFPYTTDDLIVCERLVECGLDILMPGAAPIGTGLGPLNPYGFKILRQRFPQIKIIVDAGIGRPSHGATVMEWGADGVLLNTAVSQAFQPPLMAKAFALSIESGRLAYLGGMMEAREMATASTPLVGRPFWLEKELST